MKKPNITIDNFFNGSIAVMSGIMTVGGIVGFALGGGIHNLLFALGSMFIFYTIWQEIK